MQRLRPLAAHVTHDLTPHLARAANPAHFGVPSYALMHSSALEAARRQPCHYQNLACNGTRTSLRRLGASIELVAGITAPAITQPRCVLNSELLVYLRMFGGRADGLRKPN